MGRGGRIAVLILLYIAVLHWTHGCRYDVTFSNKTEITSPGYGAGRRYPADIICTWLLRSKNYMNIEVQFIEFDLEYSENCRWDYLTIADGECTQKPKYCGGIGDKPPIFRSSGGAVCVKFVSDRIKVRMGFKAVAREVASAPVSFSEPDKSVTSATYSSGLSTITAGSASESSESLSSSSSTSPNSPSESPSPSSLSSSSESDSPSEPSSPSSSSSTSDSSTPYSTTTMSSTTSSTTQSSSPSPSSSSSPSPSPSTSPSISTSSSSPSSSSPPSPSSLSSPAPSSVITSLPNPATVAPDAPTPGGTSSTSSLISSSVSLTSPSLSIATTSPVSTPSVLDEFTLGNGETELYIDDRIMIKTPKDAYGKYSSNMDSVLALTAAIDKIISIGFTEFSVENHKLCKWDYLQLCNNLIQCTDGQSQKYCGTTIPSIYTSTGNRLVIRFHSDHIVQWYGFTALVTTKEIEQSSTEFPEFQSTTTDVTTIAATVSTSSPSGSQTTVSVAPWTSIVGSTIGDTSVSSIVTESPIPVTSVTISSTTGDTSVSSIATKKSAPVTSMPVSSTHGDTSVSSIATGELAHVTSMPVSSTHGDISVSSIATEAAIPVTSMPVSSTHGDINVSSIATEAAIPVTSMPVSSTHGDINVSSIATEVAIPVTSMPNTSTNDATSADIGASAPVNPLTTYAGSAISDIGEDTATADGVTSAIIETSTPVKPVTTVNVSTISYSDESPTEITIAVTSDTSIASINTIGVNGVSSTGGVEASTTTTLSLHINVFMCSGENHVQVVSDVTVHSPNFGDGKRYPLSTTCSITITSFNGKRLNITFLHFDVEFHTVCKWDSLSVFDGASATSTPIGKLCGTNIPTSIVSTSSSLTLKFVSDHIVQKSGFSAKITVDEESKEQLTKVTIEQPSTSAALPTDSIKTTNTPVPAPTTTTATATTYVETTTASANGVTTAASLEHNTQTGGSTVKNTDNTSTPIVKQNQSSPIEVFLCSEETHLVAVSEVFVYSPVYSNTNVYSKSTACSIAIESPLGTVMEIELLEFQVEYHTLCRHVKIVVFDGLSGQDLKLGKLCGDKFPGTMVTSGPQLRVTFTSTQSAYMPQLKAKVTVKYKTEMTTETSSVSHPGKQTLFSILSSPSVSVPLTTTTFPLDSYSSAATSSPRSSTPTMTSTPLSQTAPVTASYIPSSETPATTPPTFSTVHSVHTPTESEHTSLASITTTSNAPAPSSSVSSTPNSVTVAGSVPSLIVTTPTSAPSVSFPSTETPLPMTTHSTASPIVGTFTSLTVTTPASTMVLPTACSAQQPRVISAWNGVIMSPGYDHYHTYPPNMDCAWEIEEDPGYMVMVSFQSFDVEQSQNCRWDKLVLYESRPTDSNVLGVYCGSDLPPTITSSRKLFIKFQSDTVQEKRGFKLQFLKKSGPVQASAILTSCPGGYARCHGRERCIPVEWFCDGHEDCAAGHDEAGCLTCGEDEFDCGNGECIPLASHCNRVVDCGSNADEQACVYIADDDRGDVSIIMSGVTRHVCYDADVMASSANDVCRAGGYRTASHVTSTETSFSIGVSIIAPSAGGLTFSDSGTCPSGRLLNVGCSNNCGVRRNATRRKRIVGGGLSKSREWPWIVALRSAGKFICGGTIVDESWVITAGHCVDSVVQNPQTISITAGSNDINDADSDVRIVTDIQLPDDYNFIFNSDIALLKLQKPLEFVPRIQPICLPWDKREFSPSSLCFIAGWGVSDTNSMFICDRDWRNGAYGLCVQCESR